MTQLVVRPPSQVRRPIERYHEGRWAAVDDVMAGEEPLEIRLLWQESGETVRKSVAITMRTPGDDFALAAGFLFGEGIIKRREDVIDIAYCRDEDEEQAFNIVTVTLAPGLRFDVAGLERNFYTTSSCGVCGKASLDALEVQGCQVVPPGFEMSAATLCTLPAALR